MPDRRKQLQARIAQNIRDLVEAKDVKLAHLADRAAVGRSTLFKVLAGEQSPTIEWLDKVAEALGVEVADLVQGPPSNGTRA